MYVTLQISNCLSSFFAAYAFTVMEKWEAGFKFLLFQENNITSR